MFSDVNGEKDIFQTWLLRMRNENYSSIDNTYIAEFYSSFVNIIHGYLYISLSYVDMILH